MQMSRSWIVSVVAAGLLATSGGAATASPDYELAYWNMNEGPGSSVMHDVSGHGFHGRIGREVATGIQSDGRTAYGFERLEPDTPPARPGHLVIVPDDERLNPGSRDYSIEMRLRTRDHFGNIVQKGQATVRGGSFKLQIPNGRVQCWFRGSRTSLLVTAPRPINDGRWHTVRCQRTGDGVSLAVDGDVVAQREGWTGPIANSWPIAIGGKTDCDQVDVGCDYFAGDIDFIAIDVEDPGW
ncbi:laminin G domain-containing protein [Actinoplanes sp. Pm04-4]|uniref:Laminin G domain-containing protein n=1 Tax=Paractinoplanes pyxinae TaxID=2997416 RepID=A0ABT4AVZ6_9ACTN|nr:laminin G domain-containing protein [Actinoplanes pyxinae]MCY1138377.1 laminin G domain-containing protein [Actinoplanes pyxinae]